MLLALLLLALLLLALLLLALLLLTLLLLALLLLALLLLGLLLGLLSGLLCLLKALHRLGSIGLGLRPLLLEQVGSRLVSRLFGGGKCRAQLGRRGRHGGHLGHLLGQRLLVGRGLVGRRRIEVLLLRLRQDLLLFLDRLTDLVHEFAIGAVEAALQPLDSRQHRFEHADHDLLSFNRRLELRQANLFLGLGEPLLQLFLLVDAQRFLGIITDGTGEIGGIPQVGLELTAGGAHVPLILERGEVQFLTPILGLLGGILGHPHGPGLLQDELLHLTAQLGNFQPPHQDLLLFEQLGDDQSALFAGFLEHPGTRRLVGEVGLLQERDHVRHLVAHQRVDVVAHPLDLAEVGMTLQIVLPQLLQLGVEHVGRQPFGHVLHLLLHPLLLTEPVSGRRLGQRQGGARQDQGGQQVRRACGGHGDSPRPSNCLMNSSSSRADFWSPSNRLAMIPCSSVTWNTSGSEAVLLPGFLPR